MPPAIRRAAAPSDLADREADEAGARIIARDEQKDEKHDEQFDRDQQHADAHAGLQRNGMIGYGLPRNPANAVRELAKVLTRIPNHATP